MKKKQLSYILIFVLSLMMYYSHHNFFSKSTLTGSYINTNFEYTPFLVDIPYNPDTIKLNANKTFSSTYWGDGEYEIKYALSGTKIHLKYSYQFGKAGYTTQIERQFFSEPRIVLFQTMNHYMKKTNN